ncbi:MAG: GNAT family N-acetyltransferase [Clostridia bacterium]|nr:GNAT family N-acetyltransferase [Clostridia bacterium]
MPRKPVLEGGKRDEIIDVALGLFFEKGYDGTSVRAIQKSVGSEVGLFYYYFKNKDDLFDKVLDRFFKHYIDDFTRIVEHGRRNPCRIMSDFFEYMEVETALFRDRYAENMHRTVRWAIREHTLTIIEPFLRQIVDIQSEYYHVKPKLTPDVAALYLTHGTGSSILHEDQEKYGKMRGDVRRGVSLIMGMSAEEQELRIPSLATEADIEGCLKLAEMTKEKFPGYKKEEYEKVLTDHIAKKLAWIYKVHDDVVAVLLYSKDEKELEYLNVHPTFRRKGLAGRLVETMAAQFEVGEELSVITYRDDDLSGADARNFYVSLGFEEAEKTVVFDYPCQRLKLKVENYSPVLNRRT